MGGGSGKRSMRMVVVEMVQADVMEKTRHWGVCGFQRTLRSLHRMDMVGWWCIHEGTQSLQVFSRACLGKNDPHSWSSCKSMIWNHWALKAGIRTITKYTNEMWELWPGRPTGGSGKTQSVQRGLRLENLMGFNIVWCYSTTTSSIHILIWDMSELPKWWGRRRPAWWWAGEISCWCWSHCSFSFSDYDWWIGILRGGFIWLYSDLWLMKKGISGRWSLRWRKWEGAKMTKNSYRDVEC